MRFKPGDRVFILPAYPPGHIRIPYYVRGKSGVIERFCGAFPNPEELAFGRTGLPASPLYRVRLMQRDLWTDYAGEKEDSLDIEVYEHWLQAASGEQQ